MHFLKFIVLILSIVCMIPQSMAVSIRFKESPCINTTIVKNCTASIARAAFFSALFTAGLYFSHKKYTFTDDQYCILAGYIFGISVGHDLAEWMKPAIVQKIEHLFSKNKTIQPHKPSSSIYSAAP